LREEGIKLPILILGYTLPEKLQGAVDADLSISVSHFESLQEVIKIAETSSVKIHIKVDTGMHRQGFMLSDVSKLLKMLTEVSSDVKKHLQVEGLFTHFASAKNPAFPERTKKQLAEFEQWVELFKKAGFNPIVHAAATSSAILFPESHFDMVRIGIGLYGLWPSLETKAFGEKRAGKKNGIFLKPVLTWKTIVGEIKSLKNAGAVGYDFTETLPKNSKIAILPIGYWHGYSRTLSCVGTVLINNLPAKVVGRVSMDMVIVDVTHIKNVRVGDEVVLLGTRKEPTAMGIATLLGDSWYEILTRLNPLIKRFFV
jgi:alanine racemase